MITKIVFALLVLAGLGLALLVFVRWFSGMHLLTGDDPQVIAVLRSHPDLEIELLPQSWGIHEVKQISTQARGYFDLPRTSRLMDGEVLTGPFRMGPCVEPLPNWIRLFPKAREVTCIVAESNQGERRFVSFLVEPSALPAVQDFYETALREVEGFDGGSSTSEGHPGLDWKGRISRSNMETGKRFSLLCDSAQQRRPAAVVVICYSEARPQRDPVRP